MHSIMYEQGLGKVMTGIETAPEVRTETSENERAAEQAALAAFEEKNGRLFTRLQLATSDCAQGFMSAAAQVVQSFGPIHPKEFGDGRGAFLALESKYRREGIYRMQQLQSQLTNLAVTADDHFDPARVIQELRRISAELDALGDKVVPARKVHTLLGALPDSKYETFKAALTCEDSPDDSTLDFESIVRRVTKYHSMQIRDKVSQHDGSGTHGRAHNTGPRRGTRIPQAGRTWTRTRSSPRKWRRERERSGEQRWFSLEQLIWRKQRWKRAGCTRGWSRQPSLRSRSRTGPGQCPELQRPLPLLP